MADDKEKYARFARLGFDDFRALAADNTLTPNEKVGFPERLTPSGAWTGA